MLVHKGGGGHTDALRHHYGHTTHLNAAAAVCGGGANDSHMHGLGCPLVLLCRYRSLPAPWTLVIHITTAALPRPASPLPGPNVLPAPLLPTHLACCTWPAGCCTCPALLVCQLHQVGWAAHHPAASPLLLPAELTGTLPDIITTFSSLNLLDVSQNRLQGTLPLLCSQVGWSAPSEACHGLSTRQACHGLSTRQAGGCRLQAVECRM